MASYKILTIADKQKMLSTGTKEVLTAWGDFYKQEGRIHDALDFYERAAATDRLEDLRKAAVTDGNYFLYRRATQVLKIDPSPADLEVLAGRAAATGSDAYARQARGEPIEPPEAPPPPEAPSGASRRS
ncbi:MAG: hypothetical protein U0166_14145 [Acidobacteriota bacterium]